MSELIENSEERARNDSECSESEHDPQFKPIISLPEVKISTNEENETVLLKIRAKLYRFDSHSDPAEWKERGTGDLKLLQHNENNSVRIVMRRDKTLKICANHFITPLIDLGKHSSSDRAFVYTVPADFADECPKAECFAIKFGSIENANIFKTKFDEAKTIVSTKCCLYNGEDEDSSSEDEEKENIEEKDENLSEKIPEKLTEKSENDTKEVIHKLSELDVSTKQEEKEK